MRKRNESPFLSYTPKTRLVKSPLDYLNIVKHFFSQDQSRTFKRSCYYRRPITLIVVTIEDVIISPVFRLQKALVVAKCSSNKVINCVNVNFRYVKGVSF